MPTSQVIEGTWEDVMRQADQLAGKQVRLVVIDSRQEPAMGSSPLYATASPEERVRAWNEWCLLPRPQVPPLSDHAVSREAIYSPEPD